MGSFQFYLVLLCFIWSITDAYFASDVSKIVSRRYGSHTRANQLKYGGGVKGAAKGGVKGGAKGGTKGKLKSGNPFSTEVVYEGGCTAPPTKPPNAKLRCSFYSGCSLSCERGYTLPGGAYAVYIMCEKGKWVSQDTGTPELPTCQPDCNPPCQNQGICIAPDQCSCADQFSGPQCQFQNKPCLELPPLPQNSRRSCRTKQDYCTVKCFTGHQFPDGSAIATLTCKNGLWVPGRNDWVTIPDCQATCSPPCQNGGVCLSLNVCQCPQEFRGPQCQYSLDVCASSKLNFNGGFKCSGGSDEFSCSELFCADGMKLSFDPAPAYTCKYSEGVFHPSDVPTCVTTDPNMNYTVIQNSYSSHYTENESPEYDYEESEQSVHPKISPVDSTSVIIETKLPTPGVCYTWGAVHYKTFDDRIYSFDSECAYILVKDSVDNTFSVTVRNADSCYQNDSNNCYKTIDIYIQGRNYKLSVSDEGFPLLTQGDTVLPIPGQAVGIRTETTARFINIILDSVGVSMKWDAQKFIQVEAKESLWNRTEGLCGNLDGNPDNDIVTKNGRRTKNIVNSAASWQVDDIGAHCQSAPIEKRECPDSAVKGSIGSEAKAFCAKLLSDSRFSACSKVLDRSLLMEACTWDYCNCGSADKSDCACDTMNVYVSECKFEGITTVSNWRNEDICPMRCTGGRIYKSCGPAKGHPVCGSSKNTVAVDPKTCEEGCFCPEGKVLHNGECISESECPCRLRKKEFPAGSSVPKDCNTCTCQNGHWVCTQVSCGARCSAIGDPHYTTFDGKKYDFMGQCSYYLLETAGFSVETENVACPGAISELMGFTKTATSELPSCTKTATIKVNSSLTIKLGQNHQVVVNGKEILKLPLETAGIKIRIVSSIFLQVLLPNGIDIWWDGVSRLYIDVPASLKDQTKGLCGTFNHNQKDDFLTPEGDIEQSAISFANKWKTHEACSNMPNIIPSHPCDANMHRKSEAERVCSTIKSDIFADCYFYVDPDQYYQDCLYDMCSCQGDMRKCLCTIISSYAHECASKGINVNWRSSVKECLIQCPAGQEYQVCGDSCSRSCYDISTNHQCKKQCVEGCNCPVGQALDDNGECIPTSQCKCYSNGLVFNPGYKEIRRTERKPDLCSCVSGGWSCTEASTEEIKLYPDAADLRTMCNASHHMEFASCEPAEPITCKNMDSYELTSPAICHAGCQCKKGFVLDPTTKQCIKPSDCPCHHGAKSYKENEVVQNDCNTCTCKGGKWSCTDRQCAAECSAWGDSHYKTFDGKHYDYQGQCDYVLAKGALGDQAAFDISIQNIPCGTLGTTCSKSVTIRVSSSNVTESLTLDTGKPLPKPKTLNTLTVREIGLYAIVEAPLLGLTVRWDKGTRVYVRLSTKWKNNVKGLCGNYNDNELDDFQTPSGGMTEASPYAFGDSWKMEPNCPEAQQITDTCKEKPERRVWAVKKCGVLKSSVFSACHSEVPIDSFYDKCLFDACGCDQGGDCECLCTALAAYAQECNNRGVPIHWRSQELCPIQCDERCSVYKPCMSTCLVETCDNIYTRGKISATCVEDTCVEGCQFKPCPEGQVYFNSSYDRCIPVNECKPVCMEINGVQYLEGDVIAEDSCHTCYCSRGQKNCKGQPCTEIPTTTPEYLTVAPQDQKQQCITGWTEWINQNPLTVKKGVSKRPFEKEPLPTSLILNQLPGAKCSVNMMTDIRCRTVGKKISAKETGLDAECSLERGLVCKASTKGSGCPDFEIQVYCQCGGTTSTEAETETTTPGSTIARKLTTEEVVTEEEIRSTSTISTTTKSQCSNLVAKKVDEDDCHKYYVCSDGPNGPEYLSQTCGSAMMFNPMTKSCDLIDVVSNIRPECAQTTSTEATTTTRKRTKSTTTTRKHTEATTSVVSLVITGKPACDPETPNKPHEEDCHKFYVCDNGPDGAEYIEQTCGTSMMYNPKTLTCDYIDVVTSIRPECAKPIAVQITTEGSSEEGEEESRILIPEVKKKLDELVIPEVASSTTAKAKPTTVQTTTEESSEEDDEESRILIPDIWKKIGESVRPEVASSTTTEAAKEENKSTQNKKPHIKKITGTIQPEVTTTTTVSTTLGGVTETEFFIITSKPECGPDTPNQSDERDCHIFYVCHNGPDGPQYIQQTCGKSLLYNKETQRCDKKKLVKSLRPECGITNFEEDEIEIFPETETPSTLSTTLPTELGTSTKAFPSTFLPENIRKVTLPSTTTLASTVITGHPECDYQTLNRPHEDDCKKFYVCQNSPEGPKYVEQTCEGPMLYNPHTFSCDKEDVVIPLRPECDKRCPPGLRYRDCAINCMDLCMSYKDKLQKQGMCLGEECEPGCVTQDIYDMLENQECVGKNRWANNATCVNVQDCMCVSHDGKPVKPGAVYIEDGCKVCQCIQNYYSCDESPCKTTTSEISTLGTSTAGKSTRVSTEEETEPETKPETTEQQTTIGTPSTEEKTVSTAATPKTTVPFIIAINTMTPAPICSQSFVSLLTKDLPDESFTASSSKNNKTSPKAARYDNKVGSWSPSPSDKNPYLIIDLLKEQLVYGLQIKGNPKKDEYVTSYEIYHSIDGVVFSPVVRFFLFPEKFRGSVEANTPAFQKFSSPFEARYVKILPLTWHKNISLRVDVISCGQQTTTSITTVSTSAAPEVRILLYYVIVLNAFERRGSCLRNIQDPGQTCMLLFIMIIKHN